MADYVVEGAKNISIITQDSHYECWLACYAMLLQQRNPEWTPLKVLAALRTNGFKQADECRTSGLTDELFPTAATALGVKGIMAGSLLSPSGLRNRLVSHGALWVAGKYLADDGLRYPHVVVVIGVNESRRMAYIINPWKRNYFDFGARTWVNFQWLRDGLFSRTEAVELSCQFL